MLTQPAMLILRPTPIDELRRPHPDQKRVDADCAALLRATAPEALRRTPSSPAASIGRPAQARLF